MPYRAANAMLAVLGVVVVAALVMVGVDLARAARTGGRWKRRLIAAGLVVLGALGVGGCGTATERTTPAASAVSPRPGAPAEAADPWQRFAAAWDEAQAIAEGRLGERPVRAEDRPALLARLTAGERQIDALAATGDLAGPEADLLKAQFVRLAAEARTLSAPPKLPIGPFEGPWSPAESLRRLKARLPALRKLINAPAVTEQVRDVVLRTVWWDVSFLHGPHGQDRHPPDQAAEAKRAADEAAALARTLGALLPERLKPLPGEEKELSTFLPKTEAGALVKAVGEASDQAYQPLIDHPSGLWPVTIRYLLGCRVELPRLARDGAFTPVEGELLRQELHDAARAMRMRDQAGMPGAQGPAGDWAAAAAAAQTALRERLAPMEALAKAEGGDAEIIKRTLVDLDNAAGLLVDLDGASALPEADRPAARLLAHSAGQVSAKWLELLKARGIPLPEPGKPQTPPTTIFLEEDKIEIPSSAREPTRLCLEVYAFQHWLNSASVWEWELTHDSPGNFGDEPEVGQLTSEGPAEDRAGAKPKAALADLSKRTAALLTVKDLSAPEAALLRSKVRELMGALDRCVADALAKERRSSRASNPMPEMPPSESFPPMLVASLRQAEPGLQAVAGLEKVQAATIELGLTAAHADLLRLEEYVRVARRELAKRYPPNWLAGDPGVWEHAWECFFDPDVSYTTTLESRCRATELVNDAAELAARCRQHVEQARRAGPPLAGAELTDTLEWRRLVRIWRQAAQAAALAAPYNYAGRQRMVLRVALAEADAAALAGAGLLSEAEGGLLRSGLEAFGKFHRDYRHTIATRHVMCYGNGPERFPKAPSLEGLARRSALLGKLAASGKLRPEACLKALSVVTAELDERTPPFWGVKDGIERSRMEAEYKRLQAEARGRVRAIQRELHPRLGPLGERPEWRRLCSSLEQIGAMNPGRAMVADHLRAIRLMAAVRAELRVLYGASLLDRTEALLLRDEGAIRLSRLFDAGPSDLRNYTPGGWALYGNDGDYYWLNLRLRPDYRLVARAGLLKALLRRRVADVGPLLRSVADRLEADLDAVAAHLAAGGTLRDLLGPWREDPTGLQEAIAEARKALAAAKMPPRAAPPEPPGPAGD